MMPIGKRVMATALLAAGLMGLVGCWAFWPRTPGTSPLAALLSMVWSVIWLLAAALTFRRSRLAAVAFVAAMALLLPLALFVLPGAGTLLTLPFVVTALVGLAGYRFLRRTPEAAVAGAGGQ